MLCDRAASRERPARPGLFAMLYGLFGDAVVCLHLAFVVFVLLGGLLVLRWQRVAWVHVPAVLWAVLISLCEWTCPLTPLETTLRAQAGEEGYSGGFTEHYLLPMIYPTALTRNLQIGLGLFVLVVNVLVYRLVVFRRG